MYVYYRFSCVQDMDAIRMLKLVPTTLVIYLTLLESCLLYTSDAADE